MSWYKQGKLIKHVTHEWNEANDMNGSNFSIVAKTKGGRAE